MNGLLHEFDEVYLPDIVSPLKKFLPEIKGISDKHMEAGAKRYNLSLPIPEEVHRIDLALLNTERMQLLNGSQIWDWMPDPLPIEIVPMGWEQAKQEFLLHYNKLLIGEKFLKNSQRKT